LLHDLAQSGHSCAGQYAALTSWQGTNMTQPVPDKAEIALEYPDKFYIGTFEHTSRFEAHLDPTGFALVLERPGAEDVRKSIHMHIGFGLLAGILGELAASVGRIPEQDLLHRDQLARAVGQLNQALTEAWRTDTVKPIGSG
jgi:hypothetical protein